MKWARIRPGHYRLGRFEVTQAGRDRWEIWQAPETGWSDTGAYPARKGPTLIEARPTLHDCKCVVEKELLIETLMEADFPRLIFGY